MTTTEKKDIKLTNSATKIMDEIGKLTVIELADLVSALEDKFGVVAPTLVSAVCLGLGYSCIAFVSNFWLFLVYQGILITNEIDFKLELIKLLKDLFLKDDITNAFKVELVRLLKEVKEDDIPSNYLSFYNNFLNEEQNNFKKIKINNKILHKSKLLNYFRSDIPKKNVEKDLNDLLRKIKKNKNYFFSTKDIILMESLKSDGIKVLKKYDNLYEKENSNRRWI